MSLTREQECAMFDSAVKAIIDANTLMMSVVFADLLKLIAYDDPIRICISECYDSIDYERLKETVFERSGDKIYVNLPSGKKAIVGFVTKLIYEFHQGSKSYDKFIYGLYGSGGDEAQKSFANDVLYPYRQAFRQVFLYETDEESVDLEDEDAIDVNPAVFNELYVITASMRSELESENRLNAEERREYMELIDGFVYTVEREEGKLIRPAWLGMTKALMSAKLCTSSLSRLDILLKRYMLV